MSISLEVFIPKEEGGEHMGRKKPSLKGKSTSRGFLR